MRRSSNFKLFLAAIFVAALSLVAVSATGVPNTFGATYKATKLPPVPICAFGFDPRISPSAGETVTFNLSFGICKTLRLSVEYVVPAAVTKVVAKPVPTRRVHGNLFWVKKVSRRATPSKTLRLRFASDLQTGDVVKQKFIFRARGYTPVVRTVTQHISNG